jgi:hypothetical protein
MASGGKPAAHLRESVKVETMPVQAIFGIDQYRTWIDVRASPVAVLRGGRRRVALWPRRSAPAHDSTAAEPPDSDLALKEMVTAEQIEALASGRLDVALMRPQFANEDFESLCVAQEPLVAAVPENHALARGRLPCLADFDHAPFVMYSPLEARYFHDLVALVPEAASSLRFGGVVFRQVRKTGGARPAELFMAWKRDNDNPALKSMLDKCLDYYRPAPTRVRSRGRD